MPKRLLAAIALTAAAVLAGVVDPPRPAPDFVVQMPAAAPIHLSQYKGKVTVMIFILTTCPHCQKTIGFLSKDQKEFGPRGFQVLASAIQEDAPKAVPDFVKDFKTTFPVGYNNSQQEGRAVLDFMQHPPMLIPHMPLLSFLDREGRIRAQYEGMDPFMEESVQEENIRKQILALLNEGGAAAKKAPAKKTAAKK